jgi:hypothetical protein
VKKKRWSPLELQLRKLKNISPPPHLKQQILDHAMKLTRPKLMLIDKVWASSYFRASFIIAIVVLISLGSISDWRVSQKMTGPLPEKPDFSTTEDDLLAKEIGLNHWEDLQKIKSRTAEENAREQIWKFLEKEEISRSIK